MTVEGVTVSYGYDRSLALTAVQKTGEPTPATYTYDAAGRRTALTLPNGVTTNYGYDGAGRLTEVVSKNAAQQVVSASQYTLDPTGNRTAMSLNLGGTVNTINYEFDGAYRLTRELRKDANNVPVYDEQFTYDALGNRLGRVRLIPNQPAESTSYTYNNANQLLTETTGGVTKTYSYDVNGNTISTVGGGQTITMAYDSINRQTQWSDGTNTEAQMYRGVSWQRVRTTANGNVVNYLYDGDNVTADYTAAGTISALYVTPNLDENLSMTNAQGQTYYYTQDGLGSVRSLTDAAGNAVNKNDYTAFGEVYAANSASGVANRYTYTGRESSYLTSTNAPMYYRWRMYFQDGGMFASYDPLESLYQSLYAYCDSSPLLKIDPYGLLCTVDDTKTVLKSEIWKDWERGSLKQSDSEPGWGKLGKKGVLAAVKFGLKQAAKKAGGNMGPISMVEKAVNFSANMGNLHYWWNYIATGERTTVSCKCECKNGKNIWVETPNSEVKDPLIDASDWVEFKDPSSGQSIPAMVVGQGELKAAIQKNKPKKKDDINKSSPCSD